MSSRIGTRSKYHLGRNCSRCILCDKQEHHCTHFGSWPSSMKQFTLNHYHKRKHIPDDSCICHSDYLEIKRHRSNPEYVPKWAKSDTQPASSSTASSSNKCSFGSCTIASERVVRPTFSTIESLKENLHIPPDSLQPILLCPAHYQHVYRIMKLLPCISCGARPKDGRPFFRHSPDPSKVTQHLCRQIDTTSATISENDCLCMACYRVHLAILTDITELQTMSSPGVSLQKKIEFLVKEINNSQDKLTSAKLATTLYVAQTLQQEKALLLPSVASHFLDLYCGAGQWSNDVPIILDGVDSTVKFSHKWLLHLLISHLQPYMLYKCVIKKVGTILYPKDSDPLMCLSWALHHHQHVISKQDTTSPDHEAINKGSTLHLAGVYLNELLLNEVKKCSQHQSEPNKLDIETSIANCDPCLWDFLTRATQSAREFSGSKQSSNYEHTKKMRRFFIYCSLMYCIHPSVKSPIHIALTDATEVCGGSRELIRIMNRLGIAVSSDVHDHFVATIAEKERHKKVLDSLKPGVFTAVSADNFDMLKSHAAVFCGDQSRSYHAASIQVVQPDPNLKVSSAVQHNVDADTNTVVQSTTLASLPGHGAQDIETTETSVTGVAQKRFASGSPASSPHKLGKEGPKRKRTVTPMSLSPLHRRSENIYTEKPLHETHKGLSKDQFDKSEKEAAELDSTSSQMFAYLLHKYNLPPSAENSLKKMNEFLHPLSPQNPPAQSHIHYMELLNENPDCQETMLHISDLLLSQLRTDHQNGSVLLVGDGKTYEHLRNLKIKYGEDLKNLHIFPGDWHILKNFQPVLMKIYYEAALKQIAQGSGFRGETLTSLDKCSNFKRTHQFLVQVWESLYAHMLNMFAASELMETERLRIKEAVDTPTSLSSFLQSIQARLSEMHLRKKFEKFIEAQSKEDKTWKLWSNFVLRDCYAYVCLHSAIRTSNWNLRVASLKLMTPLFFAFDRFHYERILPHHFEDILKFPKSILESLQLGGFTVSLKGRNGHSVALDEAHEMCINKDMKGAVVRATDSYLQKTSLFFSYRIAMYKNFLLQLFPEPEQTAAPACSIIDTSAEARKVGKNIAQIMKMINEHSLLPKSVSDRGIINVFTKVHALPAQEHGMIDGYTLGEKQYHQYVSHRILHKPSNADAPIRNKKLQTMASTVRRKKKVQPLEREQRLQIKCLRKRLAWCTKTGNKYNCSAEQYSILPRALCDSSGKPHSGCKKSWTNKLDTRYSVLKKHLPADWKPDAVLLDGMFFINLTPLNATKTISDYSRLLFRRFLSPHFTSGVDEVHLLFDNPRGDIFNPKECEQQRRDESLLRSEACGGEDTPKQHSLHSHYSFQPHSEVPRPWRGCIECRQCKRSLIEAIGLSLFRNAHTELRPGQTLILAGCFGEDQLMAIEITAGNPYPDHAAEYNSIAMEVDQRIWRHAHITTKPNLLLYSPDTDIYNIGLTMLEEMKHIVVQINPPHIEETYLNLNEIIEKFEHDTDLASLSTDIIRKVLQTTFIVSGCDYVSYFKGYGKPAFLNSLFQHCEFITGGECPGTLADTDPESMELGYQACVRLVGTCYFKKHLCGFASGGTITPSQLYHSFSDNNLRQWWDAIRSTCSEQISNEEERPPTYTALYRHWKRVCWVSQMWNGSTEENPYPPIGGGEEHGWIKSQEGLNVFDWESPDITRQVNDTIQFLTKGCSCKMGCRTRKCGCVKNNKQCGPGCECRQCKNLKEITSNVQTHEEDERDEDEARSGEEEEETSSESEQSDIETEVITDIFASISA